MARKKNILLISIDDGGAYWRFRDAFRERLQVPNLDRICDQSTAFTSAYCQTPICGPSRNSVMTGLSPHQSGLLDNYTDLFSVMRPEQLWQFRLKQAGYYCATAGKVHHGFKPLAPHIHTQLYSHPPTPLPMGPPRTVPTQKFGGLTGGAATTEKAHDPLYYDHQSASDAVSFLESYDGQQPFYREVGFHHPHIPFRTPVRFKDIYDEKNFKMPEAWEHGFDTAEYPDLFWPQNFDARDLGYWRKSVRNYFSAYSHVDYQIGRVWDALQASDHARDTVVILMSDHGFHLGDKNRMRKFTLWEESCRVPLIIHDPDAEAAEVTDPVALLDIGPTVLDYANCPPLTGVQGRSLRPQVHGAAEPDRAVPTFLFGNASMRQGSYRITRYETGETEFYDVEDDPWLTRNLAGSHPFFDAMLGELKNISAAHGLNVDTPNAKGKTHFVTLQHDGIAALPDGSTKMQYGADGGGTVQQLEAVGNRDDNTFLFPGSVNRFQLTVHPGPGQNEVIAHCDDLVVYCDTGDTHIRAGNAPCVVYGGTGHDTVRCGIGAARIDGGAGPSDIYAGPGATDITTGTGTNHIHTGAGPTRISVTGGQNTVSLASSDLQLTLERTGLPQTITGYSGGQIDLSDWQMLGDIQIAQQDADTVLISASDRVIFRDTKVETLTAQITGADVRPAP